MFLTYGGKIVSSIGERIKEIRSEHGLTQQQFADSISVSRPFISRVESNKEIPSDSLVKLIGVLYHYRYEWLKCGEGKKNASPLPYKELQEQIGDPEMWSLLLGNGNKQDYSLCFSVLANILQRPNIKEGSRHFYIEQIKMILISVDFFIKNSVSVSEISSLSVHEEMELQKKLKSEFFTNFDKYISAAVQALKEEDLDAREE